MTGAPALRVLCDGWLVREGGAVVDASSTVTLVTTDIGPILVDTGSRARAGELSAALTRDGVKAGDITHVINTHLHMDHCGCNDMFPHAVFHAHALEDPPVGYRRVVGEERVTKGVRLVPTPGHTRGSISVFVEAERRYAICGDALPTRANYESRSPPAIHFDRALALRSMDTLLAWADAVVPGHDRPFNVLRKK